MGETIYLEGNYGYRDFRVAHIEQTVVDASNATWIVSNSGVETNKYPFLIDKSDRITAIGGIIAGDVPLDIDWVDAYENSAAVFMRDTGNVTISHWTISQAWDALRVDGNADNFLIDNVYLHNIRDDGVENDDGWNGTISNSLFDGVFVGISLADPWSEPAQTNVVSIENVLMRMETFSYKGAVTHGAMLKVDVSSPSLIIRNSVFAVSDVDHIDQWRMWIAWDKVIESSGNTLLNLTDQPFPKDYPLPTNGFKVVEGQDARDHWKIVSSQWIDDYRTHRGAASDEVSFD